MKRKLSIFFIVICLVLTAFQIPAQAAKLSKKKLKLQVGQTKNLVLKKAKGSVKWSSSNKKVCKVKKGKVTAVAPGTATIKAKNQKKTYKCTVRVIKKTETKATEQATEDRNTTESFKPENNVPDVPAEYADKVIGNVNSKVYHSPSCTGLPYPKNRVYMDSWQEAEQKGYRPCGNCHGGKSDADYYK